MTLAEAISVMDVLVESGDDRERAAWGVARGALIGSQPSSSNVWRLDRIAWGDGNAEHDE